MKLKVLKKDSEEDCWATCDATAGCMEYYYDDAQKTCQLSDGGCLDKTIVDDLNAFQYICKANNNESFQIYDDNLLTDAQRIIIADRYPGKPPSNYACRQGCANPDDCKVIGDVGRLGKPSLLEKTKHAHLSHTSKMKMVATANKGPKYNENQKLRLTETFDGSCDIVESEAEAADLCDRSPECDGYLRYNDTTHMNRTCFKKGPRPSVWENVPSADWSGRYFPKKI